MTRPGARLRTALLAVVALAAVVAAVQGLGIGASDQPQPWIGVYWVLIGLGTVVVGAGVWDRRPIARTGPLLVLLGGTILLASGGNLPDPWAALPGNLFGGMPVAVLVHAVLTFPSGVPQRRLDRGIIVATYALNLVISIASHVLDDGADQPLTAPDATWLATAVSLLALALRALILVVVGLLVARWLRRRDSLGFRPVGLVYLYGALTLVVLSAGPFLRAALGWSVEEYFLFQVTLIAGVPLVVATALRFGVLAASAGLDELAAWFGSDAVARPHPREALARAVGDPSLTLVYEVPPGSGAYVDQDGAACAPPGPTPSRGVVPLENQRGDTFVTYDAVLLPDPAPVVEAARVAALAVDHERLTAELLAREADLRASRRRIVATGETERRRIAHDLHDGVQARLVLAGLRAGRLRMRTTDDAARGADLLTEVATELEALAADLDHAVTDLRRVVENLMPALLREQGLFAAVDEHVHGLPIPSAVHTDGDDADLDPVVATAAWFITAEALSNVLKHAGADRVDVALALAGDRLRVEVRDDGRGGAVLHDHGHGLAGIADRAAALGGWVRVESAPGAGTTVTAELSCAS